jgi:hypothetical protein
LKFAVFAWIFKLGQRLTLFSFHLSCRFLFLTLGVLFLLLLAFVALLVCNIFFLLFTYLNNFNVVFISTFYADRNMA